jgi:hypothetical protein
MPEVRHLTRVKPVTSTIDLGDGDSVTLSFDVNQITPRWMDAAMQRVQEQDILALCEALAAVLTAWDVENEGQPWPPTKENLSVLSFPVVNRLFEEVCSSAAPSDAEGNASSASSGTAPSASLPSGTSSPNGSDTLSLPQPSVSPSVT